MIRMYVKTTGIEGAKNALSDKPITRAWHSTLTLLAARLGKLAEKQVIKSFKHVNKYTLNSLYNYGPSPGRPINKMDAVVGSYSYYLADLEDGFQPRQIQRAINFAGKKIEKPGRYIPSLAIKNNDGAVKGRYQLKKMSEAFLLNVHGIPAMFVRQGRRLIRVRTIHDTVSRVKNYDWLDKAIKAGYSTEWIQNTLARLLVTGEGYELAKK